MPNPNYYALVGMQHRGAEKFVADLPADAPLLLVREPSNKYDRNAIAVWAHDNEAGTLRHVGYIPKSQNAALAEKIDQDGTPWSPPTNLPLAAGAEMIVRADSTGAMPKTMPARLHRGVNTHPLVDIGPKKEAA